MEKCKETFQYQTCQLTERGSHSEKPFPLPLSHFHPPLYDFSIVKLQNRSCFIYFTIVISTKKPKGLSDGMFVDLVCLQIQINFLLMCVPLKCGQQWEIWVATGGPAAVGWHLHPSHLTSVLQNKTESQIHTKTHTIISPLFAFNNRLIHFSLGEKQKWYTHENKPVKPGQMNQLIWGGTSPQTSSSSN